MGKIKFESVKAGDVLWDVWDRSPTSRREVWEVRVLEIDHEKGHASCSWNRNPPTYYSRRAIERLHREKPEVMS
jgi:hypothetical protein